MRTTIFALIALAGCGSSPMMNTDPAPPAHGYQIATGPYTIPAGTEQYSCFAHTLTETEAQAITKFEVFDSPSVHHMVVFKTIAPEPEGYTDCPVLIKQTWLPLFAGGRGTPGITLPDGAGFPLQANDQILMQLHLLNAGTQASTEKTFVNLTYADDPTKVTPAGIFAVGSMNIDIPAGAMGYQVKAGCNIDVPLNVFAVFPHMHKIGTKITVEQGTMESDAQQIYARDPWVFGDQPMDLMSRTIPKGAYLHTTCTYDNTTTADVTYGEHTSNEMCYSILFYTPFTALDGCIN
jgi:hypothetical protein